MIDLGIVQVDDSHPAIQFIRSNNFDSSDWIESLVFGPKISSEQKLIHEILPHISPINDRFELKSCPFTLSFSLLLPHSEDENASTIIWSLLTKIFGNTNLNKSTFSKQKYSNQKYSDQKYSNQKYSNQKYFFSIKVLVMDVTFIINLIFFITCI